MAEKWTVLVEPKGKNPGAIKPKDAKDSSFAQEQPENMSGFVIYLQGSSGSKEEMSRVAWVRRASVNPKKTFKAALADEIKQAQDACATLNGLFSGAGELR